MSSLALRDPPTGARADYVVPRPPRGQSLCVVDAIAEPASYAAGGSHNLGRLHLLQPLLNGADDPLRIEGVADTLRPQGDIGRQAQTGAQRFGIANVPRLIGVALRSVAH